MTSGMLLGTAVLNADRTPSRRLLVTPLPEDPERLVDLNRVEAVRLAKLGEGQSEALADALVPSDIRQVLDGGPRAFHRLAQTLAYAQKWHRKRGLPSLLAPLRKDVTLLPCLPKPLAIRHVDGRSLDHKLVGGPGASVRLHPRPTLALVGAHPGRAAGVCLAMEDEAGAVLGAWLSLGALPEGDLTLACRHEVRQMGLGIWQGLEVPRPQAGEVLLLPPPEWHPLPSLGPGGRFDVIAPFETLSLRLSRGAHHPTVQ